MEFALGHPPVGFLYGDLHLIHGDGSYRSTSTFTEFNLTDFIKEARWISQQGSLIRRDVFEKIGFLDESYHFCMDLDQWIKAALERPLGYVRSPLACFRYHENSKTSSQAYRAGQDILKIYENLFERPDLPDAIMQVRKPAWASAHLYSATAWYISCNQPRAWDQLKQAILADPAILGKIKFYRVLFKLLKGQVRKWVGKA